MIEQKQLYLHKPAQGLVGDCFRTCVACVLNEDRDNVPHFFGLHFNCDNPEEVVTPKAHESLNEWLKPKGLKFMEYPLEADRAQLENYLAVIAPDQYVLIGCNSKNGGHSVVMKGRYYMWDPSIDNSGCVGPMSDGYYWVGVFIKDTSQ